MLGKSVYYLPNLQALELQGSLRHHNSRFRSARFNKEIGTTKHYGFS